MPSASSDLPFHFALQPVWILALIFFLAPSDTSAQEDRIAVLHPEIVTETGQPIRGAHLLFYDPLDATQPGEETPLSLPVPMGLALDSEGAPLVGSVTFLPLRVELLKYAQESLPRSYGTLIDSSLRGFVDFIGADFAMRASSLYFLEGQKRDLQQNPTRPFRLNRLDLKTETREVLWQSNDDVSGLTIDESGNLYVGVMRYDPLTVELMQLRPNGNVRSLGTIFNSEAGFTLARPVSIAAGGGYVYFIHQRIFSASDETIIKESIRRIDPTTLEIEVVQETANTFEGLTVDRRGQVFFGEAIFDPFRLDLKRYRPSDGSIADYGRAIDTTGGNIALLKIHLAATSAGLAGTCEPDGSTLCFHDQRFSATGSWTVAEGETGAMSAGVLGRRDSAAFYFFRPENLEMLIKVLDGCAVNGHYWVFYSATTDVGFELTVRDTVTGADRRYENDIHTAAEPVLDTTAFGCSP